MVGRAAGESRGRSGNREGTRTHKKAAGGRAKFGAQRLVDGDEAAKLRGRAGAVVMGRAVGPGPRSLEALAWLARSEVAGLEPLGLAMGLGSAGDVFARRAARRRRAARCACMTAEGSVVAITRCGPPRARRDGGDVRLGATRGAGLRHARAVSWVAALLTVRERSWVQRAGDAVARRLAGAGAVDAPAAAPIARTSASRSPVGAWRSRSSCSHKAPRRLRAILAGYEALIAAGSLSGGVRLRRRPRRRARRRRARRGAVGVPEDRLRTRSLPACSASCATTVAALAQRRWSVRRRDRHRQRIRAGRSRRVMR